MPAQTIILPPGNTHTELVTTPKCGGWVGVVSVRISTTADATIHSWEYINVSRYDNKIAYRRMQNGYQNNLYNFTLKKDREVGWFMMFMESLVKLTYTSTYPIALTYETTRGITPVFATEPPATQWNKQADATPWTTNTALNNPTELKIPDGSRNSLGIVYWVPR